MWCKGHGTFSWRKVKRWESSLCLKKHYTVHMENGQHLGAGHSPLSPVGSPDKYINAVAEAETKKMLLCVCIHLIKNKNLQ